jgi:class 3 adenylate cyclase
VAKEKDKPPAKMGFPNKSFIDHASQSIQNLLSSFAVKMGIFICLQAIILSLLIIFFFYSESKKILLRDLNTHLINLATLSVLSFTPDDLKTIEALKNNINENSQIILNNVTTKFLNPRYKKEDKEDGLPKELVAQRQASADYQKAVQLLRKIRESSRKKPNFYKTYFSQQMQNKGDAPLIRFAYLVIPVPQGAHLPAVIDIADSNYEALDKSGDPDSTDIGIPFGTLFKMEPVFKESLAGQYPTQGDWVRDKWGTWLTVAVPIFDKNQRVIAAMAIDYDINDSTNFLNIMRRKAYFFISLSILLSIFFSTFVSRQLSKPIKKLITAAQKIRRHNFNAQVDIHSHDQIGMFADVFNSMTTEIREYSTNLENLVNSYARFVPMEFLKLLDLPSILDVKLGDQVEKTMAILFCDIRSFTATTEQMSPREAIQYLNDYLQITAPIVREYHGFVDKFIGDAIMALFPRNATDAVQCAIALLNAMFQYNQMIPYQKNPIRVAIGIHAGKLMLGTVGEEHRLEGTVISDVVNFAARLESTAKLLGIVSMMSEDVKKALPPDSQLEFRYLGKMKAKGKKVAIRVYELLDALPEEIKQIKIKTRALFEKAVRQFEEGHKEEAIASFKVVLAQSPADSVALIYLEVLTTPGSPYAQYFT